MNSYYNQNYAKEEIEVVLDKIKSCVGNNKFTIALNENRQENIEEIVDVYTKVNVIDMPNGSRAVVIFFS